MAAERWLRAAPLPVSGRELRAAWRLGTGTRPRLVAALASPLRDDR